MICARYQAASIRSKTAMKQTWTVAEAVRVVAATTKDAVSPPIVRTENATNRAAWLKLQRQHQERNRDRHRLRWQLSGQVSEPARLQHRIGLHQFDLYAKQCVASTCLDAMVDVDETDVDCGGLNCIACTNGKAVSARQRLQIESLFRKPVLTDAGSVECDAFAGSDKQHHCGDHKRSELLPEPDCPRCSE